MICPFPSKLLKLGWNLKIPVKPTKIVQYKYHDPYLLISLILLILMTSKPFFCQECQKQKGLVGWVVIQ
jgi:hypothetical protein